METWVFMVRFIASSSFFVSSLVVPAAVASTTMLENTTFAFPAFDSNDHRLYVRGNANVLSPVVQLTATQQGKNLTSVVGRAMYYQPVRIRDAEAGTTADFTTWFTFSIDSQNRSQYADGLAFFLVPEGSEEIPSSSGGGLLGLTSNGKDRGNATFVAVEIDTFYDASSNYWDPQCIHLGIDLNNLTSASTACANWMANEIRSGGRMNASISYSARTRSLVVSLENVDGRQLDTKYVSVQYDVNLTEYLPENVSIGFSATTGMLFEFHTLYSWEWTSLLPVAVAPGPSPGVDNNPNVPGPVSSRKKRNITLWVILIPVGALPLVVLVGGFAWLSHGCLRERRERGGEEGCVNNEHSPGDVTSDTDIQEELQLVPGPKQFSYTELANATGHFADSRRLGKGGFGSVYGGYLSGLNRDIAIKKIDSESRQGIKEYVAEVRTISRVWHKNLVELLGWCNDNEQLLIVYEFMPNRSLDYHLFKGRNGLTWDMRFNIVKDLASALSYLHEECKPYILHRDIKVSNILLDQDFAAKLGDFGLSKLVDNSKVPPKTTAVVGTLGYLAPEYIYKGKVSKESDVYSFGVVLLEIACGRKARDLGEEEHRVDIVEWVRKLHEDGKLLDAADPNLDWKFDEKEMECVITVGLWCTNVECGLRPSVRDARAVLNFEAMLPVLPLKLPVLTNLPLAALSGSSSGSTSSSRATTNSSSMGIQVVTLPRIEARPLPATDSKYDQS